MRLSISANLEKNSNYYFFPNIIQISEIPYLLAPTSGFELIF